MPNRTSVALGKHFERFVEEQVASGRYASADEVIREGLRLVEERQKRLEALNAAIDAGLESGVSEDFSWERVRAVGRDLARDAS